MNVLELHPVPQPAAVPEDVISFGIGEAALALMEIIDGEVTVGAPRILLLDKRDVTAHILEGLPSSYMSVSQDYSVPLRCSAVMFLGPESSAFVLRCMFSDVLSPEMLQELGGDGLVELGNVLFNALLAPLLDNIGGREVICTMPDCSSENLGFVADRGAPQEPEQVRLILIDIELPEPQATLRLALTLFDSVMIWR